MTRTRGNVIVENIDIGVSYYEYELGFVIHTIALEKPYKNNSGAWQWEALNLLTGESITYIVHPQYVAYSPKLYDYKAYPNAKQV